MTATATKSSGERRRFEDFPEFKEATDNLARLAQQHDQHEARVKDLERKLASAGDGTGTSLDQAAAALVKGQPEQAAALASQRQDLAEARRLSAVAARAIEMQQKRIDEMKDRLRPELTKAASPKHKLAARAVLEREIALALANADEQAILRELADCDILDLAYIRPMSVLSVGVLSDPNSGVCRHIKEFVENGYTARNDPLIQKAASLAFLPK